jgi:putative ABC transport system permease protein
VRAVLASPAVGAGQASLRVAAEIAGPRGSLDATLEALPDARPVWGPSFLEGGLPRGGAGLVIARRAARDLGVGLGDRVRVVHPMPAGRVATTVMAVTGVHAGPLRFLAYTDAAGATAMGIAGFADRVSVVPAEGRSQADVQRALMRLPQVVSVQPAGAISDAADETLARFDDVLVVVVGIAACMALLLALNASAINADERTREHATMFAHGVPVARVVRGAVWEALIIGALGTAAGIAGGRLLLDWLIRVNVSDTLPDVGVLTDVAPATYALAIVAGTVVVALAPVLTARRLRRADVPGALRVME